MKTITIFCLLICIIPLLLDGEFIICDEVGGQYGPSIGYGGVNFLVSWTDGRGSPEQIYATRVSSSGVVLDPGGFRVLSENDEQVSSDIAFDGTNYLVVWQFGC